jgi:hypothetical protein
VTADLNDQEPGQEKAGRHRGRWRPSWRDIILVAVTAILSSMATYLHFGPMMLQLKYLEEQRLVPNMHIEVAETAGANEGEIDFTVYLANLGPKAVDIFVLMRPMQEWIAFTDRSVVKTLPAALPVEASIGRERATVRLREPLKAGSNASLTFTAIKYSPTRYGIGAQGMHGYVYADNREQWIKFYSAMRPKAPKAAGVP